MLHFFLSSKPLEITNKIASLLLASEVIRPFFELQVACGGCHMLVFAAPRPKGSEVILEDLYEPRLTATLPKMSEDFVLANTLQLSAARMRRRERVSLQTLRVVTLVSGNRITFKTKITAYTKQLNIPS